MTSNEPRHLERGIGTRQLSMIAIGGAIGTGLFFASGGAIAQAGPGRRASGLRHHGHRGLLHDAILGEMATQLPIAGSFEAYAERFVDPSLAFAVGWNYWFSWAITLAAELVAGALIVQFWFPHSNSALLGHGLFRGAAGAESSVGESVCRSRILVRRHQGRHRDHLPGGRRTDDRRHDRQP